MRKCNFTCAAPSQNILLLLCSAWEEMATDQKHPISQPLHQHTHSDQLITLHAPCTYSMPQSPLSALDALPNFTPSFSAPPRMSGRLASRSAPLSHMSGQCHSMMSAMSAPTLGPQAPCLPVQQACAAHTVAEKTGDLLLSISVYVLMLFYLMPLYQSRCTLLFRASLYNACLLCVDTLFGLLFCTMQRSRLEVYNQQHVFGILE